MESLKSCPGSLNAGDTRLFMRANGLFNDSHGFAGNSSYTRFLSSTTTCILSFVMGKALYSRENFQTRAISMNIFERKLFPAEYLLHHFVLKGQFWNVLIDQIQLFRT